MRVVTGMTSDIKAQAGTALSPEWDRGFDEAFTELITGDPELVRQEFDALIGATWTDPPEPPAPPAPPTGDPAASGSPIDRPGTTPAEPPDPIPADPGTPQRSPP